METGFRGQVRAESGAPAQQPSNRPSEPPRHSPADALRPRALRELGDQVSGPVRHGGFRPPATAPAPRRGGQTAQGPSVQSEPALGEPVVRTGRSRREPTAAPFGCRRSGATAPASRRRRGTRPAGGTTPPPSPRGGDQGQLRGAGPEGPRILKPEDRDAGRAKRRISPPPANNPGITGRLLVVAGYRLSPPSGTAGCSRRPGGDGALEDATGPSAGRATGGTPAGPFGCRTWPAVLATAPPRPTMSSGLSVSSTGLREAPAARRADERPPARGDCLGPERILAARPVARWGQARPQAVPSACISARIWSVPLLSKADRLAL